MSSKLKSFLLIITLFLISVTTTFYLVNINENIKIKIIQDKHLQTLETYYNILMHNQEITADTAYKETLSNKQLLETLSKAKEAKDNGDNETLSSLRKKVINLLEEKYKIYKMQGVLQYHFIFPNNISFLRMHKPSKYNDDLTTVRKDFDFVNKNLSSIHGFAQGRTSHGFRNVYPLLYKGVHLGALEISFSSELLQNYFTQISKIHTHFLVNKEIFNSHAWKRDDLILKYFESYEHHDYMMTITSNKPEKIASFVKDINLSEKKHKIDSLIKKEKMFSLLVKNNDLTQIISFYPVKHNITKNSVAWIVSYTNDELLDNLLETANIVKTIIFFSLLILFSFIYYIVEQIKKDKEKDKLIYEQTKMAALGEMIGNIAHQWRQPLSVISTGISGMKVQKEMGVLSDEHFTTTCDTINNTTQYLSKTIDDFRDFIKGNNVKKPFYIKDSIDSFLNLVEPSIKNHDIKVTIEIKDNIQINSLQNELNQAFINIFNNSKDALKNIKENRNLLITVLKKENHLLIEFHDNANGIPKEIIDKIFEPYFTTKHQSQGTGLGLSITYRIIVESIGGEIKVSNDSFKINNKEYYGAKFTIALPL